MGCVIINSSCVKSRSRVLFFRVPSCTFFERGEREREREERSFYAASMVSDARKKKKKKKKKKKVVSTKKKTDKKKTRGVLTKYLINFFILVGKFFSSLVLSHHRN